MKTALRCFLWVVVATALSCSSGCRTDARGESTAKSPSPAPVQVEVLAASKTTRERTTTQPATIHAYFEAHVFAKAAGYLCELKTDIGALVKAGDVLAVIGIPEMAMRREAKLASIRQLEADERRAASQVAVAEASIASYQAKRGKAEAEVVEADAALTAARVELNRVADLVKQRAVADRLLDEAQKKHDASAARKTATEAAVRSADAELNLAKAQNEAAQADRDVASATTDVARRELGELDELLKYAELVAPFDGVVAERHVEPGDLVRDSQTGSSQDGDPLFVIAQVDRVRVRVPIPERDSTLATVGDSARITLQALPGEVLNGTISRVSGALDETTRTMLVEVDLPNPDGRLRPGMFGQATITLAPPSDTLSLPAGAVRYTEQGASYVYVVSGSNDVEIVDVKTGRDHGEQIEIVEGLDGDERIVGPQLRRLKPKQKVTVKE